MNEELLEDIIKQKHSDELATNALAGVALGLDAAKSLLLIGVAIQRDRVLYDSWELEETEIWNEQHMTQPPIDVLVHTPTN